MTAVETDARLTCLGEFVMPVAYMLYELASSKYRITMSNLYSDKSTHLHPVSLLEWSQGYHTMTESWPFGPRRIWCARMYSRGMGGIAERASRRRLGKAKGKLGQ